MIAYPFSYRRISKLGGILRGERWLQLPPKGDKIVLTLYAKNFDLQYLKKRKVPAQF